MAVKRPGRLGLADAPMPSGVVGDTAPACMSVPVERYRFETPMDHLRDAVGRGRPDYPPGNPAPVLFKALLLPALYGLSAREPEEALGDRLSFRHFVGLSLDDDVPDRTVLTRFGNRPIGEGLSDKAGVTVKRGTMLDATLIEAVSSRPAGKHASRDGDARFARRRGKGGSRFGYKAPMAVDEGSDLIRAVITTPASVNGTVPADAACDTHARRARPKARGIKPRIACRANKHHPDPAHRPKRCNRSVARRRAAVETTFAALKQRMRLTAIGHVGPAKTSGQALIAAAAFNLQRRAVLTP